MTKQLEAQSGQVGSPSQGKQLFDFTWTSFSRKDWRSACAHGVERIAEVGVGKCSTFAVNYQGCKDVKLLKYQTDNLVSR